MDPFPNFTCWVCTIFAQKWMDNNMEHFVLQAALQDCECAQRCILIGSHLIRSDRSFPFPGCSCRSSGCSCRSSCCSCRSSGFCMRILIFRRCMRLVKWLVVASLNLDRFAILFSHHNFPLDQCSSTDNLQTFLSTYGSSAKTVETSHPDIRPGHFEDYM